MGRPLRIASANLWNGRADPGAFVEFLERHAIDVLATQELAPEQAAAIAERMPFGLLDPDPNHRGLGISSRFPCESRRVPMRFRDARVLELDLGAIPDLAHLRTQAVENIEVVCIHIAAPHARAVRRRPWIRHQQVRDLASYLEERPVPARAVVGDFNATPLWPAYRRIASQLTDAAVAVAQVRGRAVEATWGPTAEAPRVLRIDHGFVSGLAPVEFQVMSVEGSDHSAIVMDIIPLG